MSTLITKELKNQALVWFSKTNNYLIVEQKAATILKEIESGLSFNAIAKNLSKELDIPYEKAVDFVLQLNNDIYEPNQINTESTKREVKNIRKPSDFKYCKYYRINEYIIKSLFKDVAEYDLIHPKFSHLEIEATEKVDTIFEAFSIDGFVYLFIENKFIGSWNKKNQHYFQGKYAMEMVQKIHKKQENDWIATFHASAVAKNNSCILFLGESGDGKSTSLALLQAHGYKCIADDFVPFDKENLHCYAFPSAISIKTKGITPLLPYFPELINAKEYHLKHVNKNVTYLEPNTLDYSQHFSCEKLVFIKYRDTIETSLDQISSESAFARLIPDSWISKETENVQLFLNWFSRQKCFELTYSNNEEMINIVDKLFKNEL